MKSSLMKESFQDARRSRRFSVSIQIVDEMEKKWFSSSSKCDLTAMKKLFATGIELLNKKAAIHWAAKFGRVDVINWLVTHQADINIRTGYSPLHIATLHKQEAVIQKLIHDYNADTNIRDYSGKKAKQYQSKPSHSPLRTIPTDLVFRPITRLGWESVSGSTASLPENISPDSLGSDSNDERFRKKRRGLSLSKSFNNRRRKFIEKRESYHISPIKGRAELYKSPSVPNIDFNHLEVRERRLSLIRHQLSSVESSVATPDLVNGYAHFISNNRYHRRSASCSFNSKDKHEWRMSTYV